MAPPAAFLCHSSEDKAVAEELARELRSQGIDVWFDKWEIAPGDSLRRKIDEGIGGAEFFLALLSSNSLRSEWVQTELDAALVQRISGKCRLIPILLETADSDVPPTLAATRWVRLRENSHAEGLKELISVCHGATDKPPLGNPPAWTQDRALDDTGLSPHSQRIATLLNERCEKGLEVEFFLPVEEIQSKLGLTDREVVMAVGELEDLGIIKKPLMNANGSVALHGISAIAPAPGLFFATDPSLRKWNPEEDARELAAALANTENGAATLESLARRLAWQPRRVNPAAYYLDSYGYAKCLRMHGDTFAFGSLMSTSRTLRFARAG